MPSTVVEIDVDGARLTVRDRGRGIAPEDLGRIFDRFYRAVDVRSEPGSGLGLSIVDEVVRSHGGTVFARARDGGGAEVGFAAARPAVATAAARRSPDEALLVELLVRQTAASGEPPAPTVGSASRVATTKPSCRLAIASRTDVPAQLDTVRSGIVTVMSIDDSPERALLRGRLAGQRRHVLEQLDGLSDENLRRPVLPSGWSCLGLVRHLTLSDERYWFEVVMAGRPLDFWPEGHNADWKVVDDEPAEAVLAQYRAALASSDAIIAGLDLADPPARPEEWWADAGLSFPDLRAVLMHVIVETATHAGQLDAVRELLDGKQYLVL